jgi:hypothetical protein
MNLTIICAKIGAKIGMGTSLACGSLEQSEMPNGQNRSAQLYQGEHKFRVQEASVNQSSS